MKQPAGCKYRHTEKLKEDCKRNCEQ